MKWTKFTFIFRHSAHLEEELSHLRHSRRAALEAVEVVRREDEEALLPPREYLVPLLPQQALPQSAPLQRLLQARLVAHHGGLKEVKRKRDYETIIRLQRIDQEKSFAFCEHNFLFYAM